MKEENNSFFDNEEKKNISLNKKISIPSISPKNILNNSASLNLNINNLFPFEKKTFINNNIKYGIDENGNPINIKEYYKSINDSVNLNSSSSIFSGISNFTQKLKKPIAYIIKDENNDNILIDLKGNKINKNKDGDYDFPLQLHVIIKDFDVKHPELRINGERYYRNKDDELNIELNNHRNREKISNLELDKEKLINNLEINNINNDIIDNNINNINEYYDLLEGSHSSNNIKNDIEPLILKTNNNTYRNIFKNSLLYNNKNNKFILRTKDILSNYYNNSFTPKYFRNNLDNTKMFNSTNILKKNNEPKFLYKKKCLNNHNLENSNHNFIFKNNRYLNSNYESNNNLKNKIGTCKTSLSINNIISKLNIKDNKYNNDFFNTNKCDSYREKKIIDSNNNNDNNHNYYNKDLSNYGDMSSFISRGRNNKYIIKTNKKNKKNKKKDFHNYFIIKHNNIFNNSKILREKDDKIPKKNLNKKINKKSEYISINDKVNISSKNIFIKRDNKLNTNNNNIKLNKIKKKKICKIDIKEKMKKIKFPKKEKILNFKHQFKKSNNTEVNMYVLSEAANKMIKSYSRNHVTKEHIFNKKNEYKNKNIFFSKQINSNIANYTPSNANNSINLEHSYFSPINKYNNIYKEKNIMKKGLDKINPKYVGITLSLPNNGIKKIKSNTNNQININFTPYQIQCESLIKNNDINSQGNLSYNLTQKKELKIKRNNNNFITPSYQIYL